MTLESKESLPGAQEDETFTSLSLDEEESSIPTMIPHLEVYKFPLKIIRMILCDSSVGTL